MGLNDSYHNLASPTNIRQNLLDFETFWKCMGVHPIICCKKISFYIFIWLTCKFLFYNVIKFDYGNRLGSPGCTTNCAGGTEGTTGCIGGVGGGCDAGGPPSSHFSIFLIGAWFNNRPICSSSIFSFLLYIFLFFGTNSGKASFISFSVTLSITISWFSLYDIGSKVILSIDVILLYLSNPWLTNLGRGVVIVIVLILKVIRYLG